MIEIYDLDHFLVPKHFSQLNLGSIRSFTQIFEIMSGFDYLGEHGGISV